RARPARAGRSAGTGPGGARPGRRGRRSSRAGWGGGRARSSGASVRGGGVDGPGEELGADLLAEAVGHVAAPRGQPVDVVVVEVGGDRGVERGREVGGGGERVRGEPQLHGPAGRRGDGEDEP